MSSSVEVVIEPRVGTPSGALSESSGRPAQAFTRVARDFASAPSAPSKAAFRNGFRADDRADDRSRLAVSSATTVRSKPLSGWGADDAADADGDNPFPGGEGPG
jgi:hypothetical protein